MLLRFVNIAILTLVIVLTLTCLVGLVWALGGWPCDVHRVAGWALIALIPWKVGISAPSRRDWFWVKWLTGVEALAGPRAALPDLSAPREVALRPGGHLPNG